MDAGNSKRLPAQPRMAFPDLYYYLEDVRAAAFALRSFALFGPPLRTYLSGLHYLATCNAIIMDWLEMQLGDSRTSFSFPTKRKARKRTRRGMVRSLVGSLVDGRLSFDDGVWGLGAESRVHINGVYGAVIWHRGLFAAFIGPFSIRFWSVAGAWVEGEEGDTGASLFFSGILLPVPHGKLVELRGSLTAKITEREETGTLRCEDRPVKQTTAYGSPGGWPSVHGWCWWFGDGRTWRFG